ncbi:MAG: PD-(D/E)XK nuclease family protein [Candidatus Methanoperedens sp.]|nr:PD-(D/E)XK nuclease family protein [Candidatus Methanoperedens sp.]
MEYLYSIAKKVRSAGDLTQNENLLTGIFVWVIERYPHLLSKIIEGCNFFGQSDKFNKFSLEFEKNDLQLYCMDCPLDGSTKFGRLDAVFKGENFALGIENKVVRIGPNSLHDQIDRYCLSMKRNFSSKWLMLVITPDSEIDAQQELESLGNTYPGQVCWISWQKIWTLIKDSINFPFSAPSDLKSC